MVVKRKGAEAPNQFTHVNYNRESALTQQEKVLNWIKTNGGITRKTAMYELWIMNLPDVIRILRKCGYPIVTTWRGTTTSRYVVYRMEGADGDSEVPE